MPKSLLVRLVLPIALVGSAVVIPGVAQAAPSGRVGSAVVAPAASTPTARNIYVSETACEIAGAVGYAFGAWAFYWCQARTVPGDDAPWYQLWTV